MMSKMVDSKISFRNFCKSDINLGMELKNIAGWNQTESDWRRYLRLEPEGCFVALYDGKAVGTVTTIDYEKRFGWIGMVLVHPEYRRKGIGTALLQKAIEHLKSIGVETIKLDATPEGKKVYIPLGFHEEYELERRQGTGIAVNCDEFPAIKEKDINDIIRFDSQIFGANRGNVIRNLIKENPESSFFAGNHNNQIEGYITARKGFNAYQIGPWVSKSPSLADGLLASMFNMLAGKRIFMDIPRQNENAIEIIENQGFTIQRGFTRMFLGSNAYPGKSSHIYATSSAEKG